MSLPRTVWVLLGEKPTPAGRWTFTIFRTGEQWSVHAASQKSAVEKFKKQGAKPHLEYVVFTPFAVVEAARPAASAAVPPAGERPKGRAGKRVGLPNPVSDATTGHAGGKECHPKSIP